MTHKIFRNLVGNKLGLEPTVLFKTKGCVDALANLLSPTKQMHDYNVSRGERKSPLKLLFEQKELNPNYHNQLKDQVITKSPDDENKFELMKPPKKNATFKYNQKKDTSNTKLTNDIYDTLIIRKKKDAVIDCKDANVSSSEMLRSAYNDSKKRSKNQSTNVETLDEHANTEITNVSSKEGQRGGDRAYRLKNFLQTNIDQSLTGVRAANSMPPARHHHVKATIEAVIPKGLLRVKDTLMAINKTLKDQIAVEDTRKQIDYSGNLFNWNHPPSIQDMSCDTKEKVTKIIDRRHHISIRPSGLVREKSKKTIGRWNVFKAPDIPTQEADKHTDSNDNTEKIELHTYTEALLKVCPKPIPDSLYSCRYNHIFNINTL